MWYHCDGSLPAAHNSIWGRSVEQLYICRYPCPSHAAIQYVLTRCCWQQATADRNWGTFLQLVNVHKTVVLSHIELQTQLFIANYELKASIHFFTHCGLVTSYGDIDLGQHWFRCHQAASHYLNQCWLINKVQGYSSESNFTWNAWAINHKKLAQTFFNHLKPHLYFPGDKELNTCDVGSSSDIDARKKRRLHCNCNKKKKLTHWPLGDLDAILKLQFSIFYWLVSSHR